LINTSLDSPVSQPSLSSITLKHHLASTILPDPTDKKTILGLAQMSWNGYFEPDQRDKWIAVPGWSDRTQFGWKRDGVRGYIYVDDTASVRASQLYNSDRFSLLL
jgi:putative lipase involved disintegration of autophagic bodies